MTADEKSAQLGDAVTDYQAAKIECAHIDKKIDRIFLAYRTVGETMNRDRGTVAEPRIVDGKLALGRSADRVSLSDLLSEPDLYALIAERDAARKRMKAAEDSMRSLGITDLK